ncbi:MAG: DMT family transporter [Candidatus Rokuibacteriota bacterium]
MPQGPRRPNTWVGYVLVAAAATSWGSQSVVAKILLASGLAPSTLVSARTASAFLLLILGLAGLAPRLLRVTRRTLGRIAVLGIFGMALSQYTYYFALTQIPVVTALLVIFTSPLFVLAASALAYREPVRRGDLVAAVVTLAGAALVIRVYDPAGLRVNALGIAASLFCAVSFAFYSLWAKTVPVSPWTMLTYSLGTAAAFWIPLAPPWGFLLAPHPPRMWAGFAVIVVFGTLVPFGLFLAGLRRISAAHASVMSTLEPVVAAGVALVVLGESLAWPQLAGGALVLAGIGLLHTRA